MLKGTCYYKERFKIFLDKIISYVNNIIFFYKYECLSFQFFFSAVKKMLKQLKRLVKHTYRRFLFIDLNLLKPVFLFTFVLLLKSTKVLLLTENSKIKNLPFKICKSKLNYKNFFSLIYYFLIVKK